MDFLKTFVRDGHCLKEEAVGEENVELSLGLSLNGRFGVERRRVVANNHYDNSNRLIRASSVANFSSFQSATEDPTPLTLYPPLTRTCSLPIETEEEWKKRKESQSYRRSEAKRKRVEKLKNGRDVKESTAEGNCESKRRNRMNGKEPSQSPPPLSHQLPRPPSRPSVFPSQVSTGSPASGGSSGVTDLESQPVSELNSTASQHQIGLKKTASPGMDETLKMMLAHMPCVSTGVNGRKVQGFLYKYKNGEQVRIVCVCHGSFLSPAEFVKHGGGGDVQNPLRHIVVNPPSLFL